MINAESGRQTALGRTAPPLIALLTDFGLVDDAVGLCKGMILGITPDANIVDVTHHVTPFDVHEAAVYIKDSFRYFPSRTVFACVTLPETGVKDDVVGIRTPQGHTYFSSNNGLLTHIIREAGVAEAYRVTATQVRRPVIDPTFYGRDIVMSAAAHIANGVPLCEVGPAITLADLVTLPISAPAMVDGWLVGEVAILDKNFGNVWTTITQEVLSQHGIGIGTQLEIQLGDLRMTTPLLRTFGEVKLMQPLAYIASRQQLGVALNQGNFAAVHGTKRGDRIRLRKQ